MTTRREKFGTFIRRKRQEQELGLREMAKKIKVSPTYLSKVERNEFKPPTESKVRSIAKIIRCNPDELLAMANRVPDDLAKIIRQHPVGISMLLRTTKNMSAADLTRLTQKAEKGEDDQ